LIRQPPGLVDRQLDVMADTARALLALQQPPPGTDPLPLRPAAAWTPELAAEEITVGGRRVRYHIGGSGPPLVLLHGLASAWVTWQEVTPGLLAHYTLIVPDLFGHGAHAPPGGDYSPGAQACGVRDLLSALELDPVTVVGHSLGGAAALRFAYLFPERCERLVLVSSGGLGREVHYALRAGAIPGMEWVLAALRSDGPLGLARPLRSVIGRIGLPSGKGLHELARGMSSIDGRDAQNAFMRSLRAIVYPGGQRTDATGRPAPAAGSPTLIVWGARDQIIPSTHGLAAQEAIPGSELIVFEAAGHFPQADDPERFVETINEFHASTQPTPGASARWRQRSWATSGSAR
jgi:pimeloyl-ACP methyl ester carboxylesterase